MSFRVYGLTVVYLLAGVCGIVKAQDSAARQFLPLDDWTYDLVEYWINSGTYPNRFVLNQPYDIKDIQKNLTIDNSWRRLQTEYYRNSFGEPGLGKVILYGRDNVSLVSDSELPTGPGLSQAPVDDVALFENASKNHFNFSGQVYFLLPHVSFVNRTMINSELKDDPKFFGDTGEWIFGRINDSYVNANAGPFDLFLGRMDRNWGAIGSPGLILSDNPYSYDHLQLSYSANRFKFNMIVTRLEDLQAAWYTNPDSTFLSRKFMTAHRLDFSVSPRLQFALTEIAMYGGPDRDFEFGFLNPMNYFYLIQRNNEQGISGLWAIDLFYKPASKTNFFLQFLLDDVIVNNEPGQNDRANFPDRLGLTLKLSQADVFANGLQAGIEYNRVGNRTYQSQFTAENFHYREKGLGFPTASIERVAAELKYFGFFPILLKFKTSYQRAGEITLTDAFPLQKEKFPVGTVEKRFDWRLDMSFFPNHWSRFTTSVAFESWRNYNHIDGEDRSNFALVIGLQTTLSMGLEIN